MKLALAALGVLCLHVGNTAISGIGNGDETFQCDLSQRLEGSFESTHGFRFTDHPHLILSKKKKRWQVKVGPIQLDKASATQGSDKLRIRGQKPDETWFVEMDARTAKATFSAIIPSHSPWERKVATFYCN